MRSVLLSSLLLLAACQSVPANPEPPRRQFVDTTKEMFAVEQFNVNDPIEGTNKQLYKFNAEVDEYVLLPVVDSYKYVASEFVRNRVHDFFLNVGEFNNFTNAVFQLKPEKAGTTLGRFAVNTTAGVLGTFDVATEIGLKRQPNDFGKTLGYYGVDAGPYLVLPFFGPSNIRDTTGLIVDIALFSIAIPNDIENSTAYEVVDYGVQPIDMRANNNFRYYESGSPFEYELVRYISSTGRQLVIDSEKGQKTPAASAPAAASLPQQ